MHAGVNLVHRLFGGSTEAIDYVNICTTIFTPTEYACVGLSEDAARKKFGENGIQVYHCALLPVEWFELCPIQHVVSAFTKVIVDKMQPPNVLGIHLLGRNAGKVIQRYGVLMRRGLSLRDFMNTAASHPLYMGDFRDLPFS